MIDLELEIGGYIFQQWESMEIFTSMTNMSGAFAASTANFFDDPSGWNVTMASAVVAKLGGIPILNGYLDNFDIEYGPDHSQVTMDGRDKPMDIIDCSFGQSPNEWKNQTIKSIITNLLTPFEIQLQIDSSVSSEMTTTIQSFKADEGDTVADIISRILRDYGMLAVSTGDGKLTLTKATTTDNTTDPIQFGQNAVSGSLEQSQVDRFSKYIVKGMGQGSDNKSITDFSEPSGQVTDTLVTRNRPTVIFAEGPADSGTCLKRAKWESMVRAGLSRRLWYDVNDWDQSDGNLWLMNQLVRVKDTFLGVDKTMLIDTVVYTYNQGEGQKVRLGVVHKDTYTVQDKASTIKLGFDA